MFWMMLIMTFPVVGLALFLFLPVWIALPIYLAVLVIAISCHWLMMRSMRLRAQVGNEVMIGAIATVLDWRADKGQVQWNGEIWQAKAPADTTIRRGDRVIISGMSGLTVLVKPVEQRIHDGSVIRFPASHKGEVDCLSQTTHQSFRGETKCLMTLTVVDHRASSWKNFS